MSDDERGEDTEGEQNDAATPPESEGDAPKPSTWAGRKRVEHDGEDAEAPEADGKSESYGFTSEFEKVERQLASEFGDLEDAEKQAGARTDHEIFDDLVLDEDVDAEADDEELTGEDLAADEPGADPEEAPLDKSAAAAAEEKRIAAAAAAGETIEADTLSLSDREAAQEAAHAGLKARTAEQAGLEPDKLPKRSSPPPATAAGAAAAAAAAAAGAAAASGAAAKAAGAAKPPPAKKLPIDKPEPEPAGVGGAGDPPKRGFGWRFGAASFVIVAAIGAATAISIIVYFAGIATSLGKDDICGSRCALNHVNGGDPQTIMILGSDTRAPDPKHIKKGQDPGRSDTTLLLRIDPDKNLISLLSLPRDLKVNIPGYGVDKLNAAYSYGGPSLTLKTVKNLLGIQVNHLVNVDFDGFYDAVNAIDCVYIDVDRHYFHSNAGLPPSEYYDEIDVPAGYQRLCGYNALNYVRFRHLDNDLVRGARQQDFVREARHRVPPSKLIDDRNKLIGIFTKYTSSDISSPEDLLGVLKTFFVARDAKVHQVEFEGDIGGPTSTYVTASSSQIQDVVKQFLGDVPTPDASASKKSKPATKPKKKPKKAPPPAPSANVVDVSANTLAEAQKMKPKVRGFPLYYPTQAIPSATLSEDSRAYRYLGPEQKTTYRGYRFVFGFPGPGYDAYYGFQGTNWVDPPILDDPTETKVINGKQYLLFYDGSRLRMIGWKSHRGSYWLDNSLTELVDPQDMIAIATSVRRLGK